MVRRILPHAIVLAASVILAGCPQHVEKIIDESMPPADYRPVYLTSAVTFKALLKERGITVGSGADARPATPPTNGSAPPTNGSGTTTGVNAATTGTGKLAMEIRNVDDRKYPDMI